METAYRYFHEVVKHRSIRRAAEAMNMSASSVSRQIRQLEHAFGTQLIVRNASGVHLTAAGEVLARFVRSRSRELDRVRAAIDALKGLRSGHLTIHTVEGTMGGLLQNALTRFAGAHPEITYELLVAGTDDVMRAVAEDRCEIGIAFYPQPRPEIEALLRLPAPLLAVMAPDHRLAEHRFLALGDLAAEPVALPTARFGIRHLLDHIVKTHNVELAVRLETNSVDMLRQFAICGLGITFLPAFGIERELRAGTLVAVPLEREIVSPSTLQVVKRSEAELSPPAGRFVNILSEVAGGLG